MNVSEWKVKEGMGHTEDEIEAKGVACIAFSSPAGPSDLDRILQSNRASGQG